MLARAVTRTGPTKLPTGRWLRGALAAVLLLAGAGCVGPAPVGPGSRAEVTVATWNIAWFGDGRNDEVLTGNRRDGRHLRGPEDIARLRGVVSQLVGLGVEAVGLQEIENLAAARRLFPESEWRVFLSGRDTDPAWAQRTAIAVRRAAGWAVERHPDLIEWSPRGRDRYGVDLTLSRGAERVRLLTLHLRSGCNAEPLRSDKPQCGFLRMQFAVLKGWLHDRLAEGVPVIVAGDWNRLLSRPGEEALRFSPVPPLVLPSPGSSPGCWDGVFEHHVDHIVGFAVPGTRAIGERFEEIRYRAPRSLRDRLSDHCPLLATVAFE